MGGQKIEIKLVDGVWQWMGLLDDKNLAILCKIADILSDASEEGEDE